MSDHYSTLGVDKTAGPDDIKRAYRRLASQHHPDKGGDTKKFQELQTAYDTLSDPQKRAAYDNPSPIGPAHGGGWPGGQHHGNFNFNDIFQMFGARFGNDPHNMHQQATRLQLWISLHDVATGGPRAVSIGHAQGPIEINIPRGVEDGDSIRYSRLGPGHSDLVVTYRIKPDTALQRQGDDLHIEVSVSIWNLILGADQQVPTINGNHVIIAIPPRTQPSTIMRVRGHGLPNKNTGKNGDMMVRIQARLPDSISNEILEVIQREHTK